MLVRKIANGDCKLSRVRQSTSNNSTPTKRCFINFGISVFFEKHKFYWNLTRLTSALHADLSIFFTTPRRILVGMKNISEKGCRENQNTHLMFNNFFPPKMVPFMR